MKVKAVSYGLGSLAGLILSANVLAETDPRLDAGALMERNLQDRERLQNERLRAPDPSESDASKERSVEKMGPTFKLNSVRFSKSEYLSQEQLRNAISPWLGKDVTFSDLELLKDAVNALYRKSGIYTAVATLPQQRIENGLVMIRLVEGKLGSLKFEGNDYSDKDYLRNWLRHKDQSQNIDTRELEADILDFNRINTDRLQAELRAGEAFGLTDIVIKVDELPRNKAQIIVDNQGYESTGEDQLSAFYQRQKLFTNGDRSLAYLMLSQGNQSLNLNYNAPLGQSKWRLGGSLMHTLTSISGGEFSVLDIDGDSSRLGLESSYLAYSTPSTWINGLIAYNSTWSETDIGDDPFTKYQNEQFQLGVDINWVGNNWQLNGRQLFTQVVYDDLRDSNDDEDIFLTNTKISAIYNAPPSGYFVADFEYQDTPQKAVQGNSSFSLGGPTTIRGYEPGFVSGDWGWYQQLEFHYNGLRNQYYAADLYVFMDYGVVKSLNPTAKLGSAGIGVNLAATRWLNLDMTLARGFNEVLPDQADWVSYVRVTCNCWN